MAGHVRSCDMNDTARRKCLAHRAGGTVGGASGAAAPSGQEREGANSALGTLASCCTTGEQGRVREKAPCHPLTDLSRDLVIGG